MVAASSESLNLDVPARVGADGTTDAAVGARSAMLSR